jgi:hypothetical protein
MLRSHVNARHNYKRAMVENIKSAREKAVEASGGNKQWKHCGECAGANVQARPFAAYLPLAACVLAEGQDVMMA